MSVSERSDYLDPSNVCLRKEIFIYNNSWHKQLILHISCMRAEAVMNYSVLHPQKIEQYLFTKYLNKEKY